jgi:hypothetical protein|tara:strand:+ start:1004 stop:1303 length:300 start_codon:yes stop_codon:yes gene_type:complete
MERWFTYPTVSAVSVELGSLIHVLPPTNREVQHVTFHYRKVSTESAPTVPTQVAWLIVARVLFAAECSESKLRMVLAWVPLPMLSQPRIDGGSQMSLTF